MILVKILKSFQHEGTKFQPGAIVGFDLEHKYNLTTLQANGYLEILKTKIEEKEKSEKKIEEGTLAIEIFQLLLQKQISEATELLVTAFMEKNYIYTTRHDEKSEIWIYAEGIYVPQGKTFIQEFCRQVLGETYKQNLVNTVIQKISADTYIDEKEFFQNNIIEQIAVQNGILHLHTRELTPFTPKQIFFNKLPVTYDSEAKCPIIQTFLKEVTKHENDVPLIEEIFAYTLYKKYTVEKAFMFNGSGRNGKSKTIELLKNFIGIENCSSISLKRLEKDHYSKSELFGKLANLAGDISSTTINESSIFKELTGQDIISAPRKFLTDIVFRNYAKLIYACNDLPLTKDDSFAFWSRWLLMDFPHTFLEQTELDEKTEEDHKQLKKLTGGKYKLADLEIIEKIGTPEELSGLLNVTLEALDRLLKNKKFTYSQSTEEVKEQWIRKSDSFQAFMMDNLQEEYANQITKQALKSAYFKYCKNHKLKPLSDNLIKATLTTKMNVTETRKSVEGEQEYYWVGVSIKPQIYQK